MEQFKEVINGTKPVYYAGKQYTGAGVSYEVFDLKVSEIANKLGWLKEWIYAVMFVETAGTFSPSIKNTQSSATGLIQFMQSTANYLGTTTAELSRMNAVKQLDYVYKYFLPYKNKVKNGYDVYIAVFRPSWLDDKAYIIKAPSEAYMVNRGVDIDNNGTITYQNFIDWVNARNPTITTLFSIPINPDLLSKNISWVSILLLAIGAGFVVKNNKQIFR